MDYFNVLVARLRSIRSSPRATLLRSVLVRGAGRFWYKWGPSADRRPPAARSRDRSAGKLSCVDMMTPFSGGVAWPIRFSFAAQGSSYRVARRALDFYHRPPKDRSAAGPRSARAASASRCWAALPIARPPRPSRPQLSTTTGHPLHAYMLRQHVHTSATSGATSRGSSVEARLPFRASARQADVFHSANPRSSSSERQLTRLARRRRAQTASPARRRSSPASQVGRGSRSGT